MGNQQGWRGWQRMRSFSAKRWKLGSKMQENLEDNCSRPYANKNLVVRQPPHGNSTTQTRQQDNVTHQTDDMQAFERLWRDKKANARRAGLGPAFYDKNGETEKHQRIYHHHPPDPPKSPPFKGPHHAMSSSYATSGILCCLPIGEMSNPFWIYLCFFEFHLASLMVTINTATCAIASSPICAFSCSGSCIREKYCPWAVSENVPKALQANNLVT